MPTFNVTTYETATIRREYHGIVADTEEEARSVVESVIGQPEPSWVTIEELNVEVREVEE